MRFCPASLFLFLFLPLWPSTGLAQSARKLNTEGFQMYKQKKYEEALGKFQAAVEKNPGYALAHFNLACTLGVLRKQGRVCDSDAYKGTIIEHLKKAVKLSPKHRKKIRKDPDLDDVRDTFGYHILIGLSWKKTRDVKTILQNVTWYGPAPGAYGPHSGIEFQADGKLNLWTLEMDPEHEELKRKHQTGTYTVQGNKIRIQLDEPVDAKQDFEGTLKREGSLEVPGLPGPFTDDPDECSA